jgi:membrane-bound lytic murein transglycosylase D
MSLDELFDAGRTWVEDNFTEEEVAQLSQVDLQRLAAAVKPVVDALQAGDFETIATVRPQALQVLAWLRNQPWGQPYVDWLQPRMDYLDMATQAVDTSRQQWADEQKRVAAAPLSPPVAPRSTLRFEVVRDRVYRSAQSRRVWDRLIAQKAPPARAAQLAPRLKEIFRAEGVPGEMVWLAEVESSFDPDASSPVGARGLFQLMPATAQRFGLSTFPFDERTNPEKSARAAAQYLRVLHNRFGDWPLALAAYNAGENRVGRELAGQKTRSFDAIADRLPAETRFYVPKVLATVAARENVDPFALPAPTPVASAVPAAATPAAVSATP